MTIDIFCDVIDNFGDAGVCWRLASIFSREHGFPVKLYINDAQTLSKITSGLDPKNLPCLVDGIEIHDWKDAETSEPSQVVIETFGCRLPYAFEQKIASARPQPIWINLEYLSAEDWVEGCHSLPSPHPSLNVNKYYFFPGVTKKTGGLMIEKDLFIRQKHFSKDRNKFLEAFNLDPEVFTTFVFCYPSAPLAKFYIALQKRGKDINLLLPKGAATEILSKLYKEHPSRNIHLGISEMVPQSEFDKFLWASDAVIIRGEDSFVRAQLSGKPFIWNIYPQTEETHIKKLEAFGERIRPFYGASYQAWIDMNLSWNKSSSDLAPYWNRWGEELPLIKEAALRWRDHLVSLGSLADNLLRFVKSKI